MHTLREKATALVAIAAGEPVFFQADALDPTKFNLVGVTDFVVGDKFAGISVEACGASEVCYYAPPGADAVLNVAGGTWVPGGIVYFEEASPGLVTAPTGGVDQAIARVKPIRSLDETVSSVAGPNYIAVTVLNGLPF
jgi:hypothetical protein